jgi:hypothetical protein
MSVFLPAQSLGSYMFTSGYNTTKIDGPKRTSNIIEHEIPGREGGIVEYLGSKQPQYKIQGFLAPSNDVFGGPAGAAFQGSGYVPLTPEAAMGYLNGMRVSGASLFKVESSWSRFSGVPVYYENDFFFIDSITFAMEAGRGYPYYPYTIDLMRASYRTFGCNSGTTTLPSNSGNYMSGYMRMWQMAQLGGSTSGLPLGGTIIGLGVYCPSAASGNLRVGIYSGSATNGAVTSQSPPQPVTSGWNYFPVYPALAAQSGYGYTLMIEGDATNSSGYTIGLFDAGGTDSGVQSGATFASTGSIQPTLSTSLGFESGYHYDIEIVTL